MSKVSAQSVAAPRRAAGTHAPWAVALFRAALILTTYMAGVHLAAATGAETPGSVEEDASSGPACVGCHQGGEEDGPASEGGPAPTTVSALGRPSLAAAERQTLLAHFQAASL